MTSSSLRIVLATRNLGKASEFERLLGHGIAVDPLPPEVELPQETGTTFAENAELKAAVVFRALGSRRPVLADDSGLEVTALGGEPGIRSARFAGPDASDRDNVEKLLALLQKAEDRSARFVCHLVLELPDPDPSGGAEVLRAAGFLEGVILKQPRGEGGFGYDPVFQPAGWHLSLSEVTGPEKDAVSHRSEAVRALRRALMERGLLGG